MRAGCSAMLMYTAAPANSAVDSSAMTSAMRS
jgi:hypothetical protein